MKKKDWLHLALIAGCFFALRFLVLWTGVERTCHYDELDLGTIAKELIQGLKLSFQEYQLDAYSGESLVLGLAVVPFFKLMGMNLMAIKMVPLFFSFFVLVLSFFFLRRNFGEKAAWCGAWLLTLCPAGFVQLSLVGMSGHTEELLWSLGSVAAFYEYLRGGKKQHWFLFFSGVLSGFGFWFYYANGIMGMTLLAAWVLIDRRSFLGRALFIFAAGCLIGFLPWIVTNHRDLFYGAQFFLPNFSDTAPPSDILKPARKFLKLMLVGIPTTFVFEGPFRISERIFSYFYWALYFLPAAGWGMMQSARFFRGEKKQAGILPLALFIVIFILTFILKHFELRPDFDFVGYRYLTPLIYWSLLLFAIAATRLEKKGKVLLFAVLGLGLLTQSALMFREPGGRALLYKGYSYYQISMRWQASLYYRIHSFKDVQDVLQKYGPLERYYLYWGLNDTGHYTTERSIFDHRVKVDDFLGHGFEKEYPFFREWDGATSGAESVKQIAEKSASIPGPERSYYIKGWFDWWWKILSLVECPECIDDVAEEHHPWAFRDLGKYLYYTLLDGLYSVYWRDLFYLFRNDIKNSDLEIVRQNMAPFKDFQKAWIYEGMGRARLVDGMYSNMLFTRAFETFLRSVPADNKQNVFWGLGWGIREMFREDALRASDWIQALPAEGRDSALKGMREFENWYRVPQS